MAGVLIIFALSEVLLKSARNFLFVGLWPFAGSVFMFWVLGESIPAHEGIVDAFGLGAVALGLISLGIYWRSGSRYFGQHPTLGRVPPAPAAPGPSCSQPSPEEIAGYARPPWLAAPAACQVLARQEK
jgi:hypothetical protein